MRPCTHPAVLYTPWHGLTRPVHTLARPHKSLHAPGGTQDLNEEDYKDTSPGEEAYRLWELRRDRAAAAATAAAEEEATVDHSVDQYKGGAHGGPPRGGQP